MKIKIKNSLVMEGHLTIGGAKNACLPEMVAPLLTKEEVVLTNVPDIADVDAMIKILKKAKVQVVYHKDMKTLKLKRRKKVKKIKSPYISKIRASYYLMGALFSIGKKIITAFPGGCSFVTRPINYHLNAFQQMGATIKENQKKIIIKRKRKYPTTISLPTPSLGTTINIIFASVLTKGVTTIENPSLEPEVLDVIKLLKAMNANIVIKNNQVIITGVKKLKGTTHQVIPDRMEAGSYMLLASSVKKSNVLIKNVNPLHLTSVIEIMKEQGVNITVDKDTIRVIKNPPLKGTNIVADNYPHFPTDLQQVACSYLLTCNSLSIIKDNIYPKRFSEVLELLSMNANIYIKDTLLLILPSSLVGNIVQAADLRAGFSLIVAGCIAEGETIIENADVILRGYEHVIAKLKNCKINAEII